MPDRDITVEFWARTPVFNLSKPTDHNSEFLSFAASSHDAGALPASQERQQRQQRQQQERQQQRQRRQRNQQPDRLPASLAG